MNTHTHNLCGVRQVFQLMLMSHQCVFFVRYTHGFTISNPVIRLVFASVLHSIKDLLEYISASVVDPDPRGSAIRIVLALLDPYPHWECDLRSKEIDKLQINLISAFQEGT
jgi:hypothetical protein